MPEGGIDVEAFQACLRAPFATLGITTDGRHLTGIRFLPAHVKALAPPRDSLAYLACVQLSAYLDDPSFEFDLTRG